MTDHIYDLLCEMNDRYCTNIKSQTQTCLRFEKDDIGQPYFRLAPSISYGHNRYSQLLCVEAESEK